MKKIIVLLLAVVFISAKLSAQSQYEISYDKKHNNAKVLKGIISKQLISGDTSFSWYAASQKIYQNPDTAIVNALAKAKGKVSYILFGGTWCEDTQFILPKFFRLQEKSGVPDDQITFFGVNSDKQSMGNITKALNITNVPTIIVMKNGKEIGRVVEYGSTGHWDNELAAILKGL